MQRCECHEQALVLSCLIFFVSHCTLQLSLNSVEVGLWMQELSPSPMVWGTFSPAPSLPLTQNWATATLFLVLLYQVPFTSFFLNLGGKRYFALISRNCCKTSVLRGEITKLRAAEV